MSPGENSARRLVSLESEIAIEDPMPVSAPLRDHAPITIDPSSIIASMSDAVVAVDSGQRVVHGNRAFGDMFRANGDLVGRHLQDLVRDTEILGAVTESLECEQEIAFEFHAAGDIPRVLAVRVNPLRSAEGHCQGALVVCVDMTTLRRLENVRQEFVANVSHELKTPITAIIGFAETLLSGAVVGPDAGRRYTEIIARQALRLKRIVEDLLSLSRLEQEMSARRIEMLPEALCELLRNVTELCHASALEKEIRLCVDCEDDIHVRVNSSLFEQAMVNLVQNAVKYSKVGDKVLLKGVRVGTEISISVIDHGPGIDPEHLPRLFERFYRVHKGRSREHGGTGLGLAIVKHVSQIHDGQVTVRSEVGAGSEFTIWLPSIEPQDG
ncbi:MAG: PAS domain-containing protein [Deltaproteobacteria bacterium]|nr:PAS domain-containing protein [Deltaproteobacteria bacterium]